MLDVSEEELHYFDL